MQGRQLFLLFICILCTGSFLFAQGKTKISVNKANHDFGVVKEEGGEVEHTFVLKNDGKSPLVIDRITTSCGCTLPEWSKEPVPPGGTKEIKIWYDPYGRPGRFYKTISVYSNAEPRRFVMTIEGEVQRKPAAVELHYPYSIGPLKLTSNHVSFNAIRWDETLGEKIHIKNSGEKPVLVILEDLPPHVIAEARPVNLAPDETGELYFLLNAKSVARKGRYLSSVTVKLQQEGAAPVIHTIPLTANIIDDFSRLSASDKEKAPYVQLSSSLIDFGKVENKTSILGIGGKEIRTFEITNNGKSPLIIYSLTSDDPLIDISGGKEELKPGASAAFKVAIRPKDFKVKLESTITVVCNAPNAPVRLIKITAEK